MTWTWAEYIRRRRAALGLTQVGMEDWLGVGRRVVSAWEQGRNEPPEIMQRAYKSRINNVLRRPALRKRIVWIHDELRKIRTRASR